ncbi:MAG: hypothetical protein ABSE69_03955 [Roseiarcus sp.]|jgi:hypothetical protein
MVFTILMFFVLILSFAAMFGFVKFAENVIAKPQLAPLNDNAAAKTADGGKSL